MWNFCTLCLRLYPRHASALNNLGTLTHSSEEAENFYRRALDINPQHNRALFNLGNLLKCVKYYYVPLQYMKILKSCDVTQTFFFYMLAFLKLDSGKLLVLVKLKGPLSLNMIETVVTTKHTPNNQMSNVTSVQVCIDIWVLTWKDSFQSHWMVEFGPAPPSVQGLGVGGSLPLINCQTASVQTERSTQDEVE